MGEFIGIHRARDSNGFDDSSTSELIHDCGNVIHHRALDVIGFDTAHVMNRRSVDVVHQLAELVFEFKTHRLLHHFRSSSVVSHLVLVAQSI